MNARAVAEAFRALADAFEAPPDVTPANQGASDLVDARSSGLGHKLFRRLVREGVLSGSRVGRRYLVKRGELDRWLAAQAVTPRAAKPPKVSLASATSEADQAWARVLSAGTLRVVRGAK